MATAKKKTTRKPANPFTAKNTTVITGGLTLVVPEMAYDNHGVINASAKSNSNYRETITIMADSEKVWARGTCGEEHCIAANKAQAIALRDFLNMAIDNLSK